MAETNINAYKAELVEAEKALDRAKSRVEELKAHIGSVDEPEVEEVSEDFLVEATPKKKGFFKKKGKK